MQRHLVGEICTRVWINWKCLPCIFRSNHVENGKQLSWIKHTTKFNRQHLHLIVILRSKIVGGIKKCRYKGKSILVIGRWHNWVILATVVSVPLASAWHQNLFVFHYFFLIFILAHTNNTISKIFTNTMKWQIATQGGKNTICFTWNLDLQ